MVSSALSLRVDLDEPIKFKDRRIYKTGDWVCQQDARGGLMVTVDVSRMDTPHHSPRYRNFGDWFWFDLYFPDMDANSQKDVESSLEFSWLWITRFLANNPQPRSMSHTGTTIEGNFKS